ncbi:GumC family protein [Zooshikella sp. RANM57]|uniref:GumC family protein n=1 Tax=Zooshikella sp. RANM57 TaxID=3425863 RepID=UPI003D6EB84E
MIEKSRKETSENYLHEFLRIFFANQQLIKRVFILFVSISILVPVIVEDHYELTGEVLVLSKKLSQSDADTVLTGDTDKFVPLTVIDMETESNILRSTGLIRTTVSELYQAGKLSLASLEAATWLGIVFENYIIKPLQQYIIQPMSQLLGVKEKDIQHLEIDKLTTDVLENLTIEPVPGSNVINVTFISVNPEQGVILVNSLLNNYLLTRDQLQSAELPYDLFKKKRDHYRERYAELEKMKLDLLTKYQAANPEQELIQVLASYDDEQESLYDYLDTHLEKQRWVEYLTLHLQHLKSTSQLTEYTFPYTFTETAGSVAYDDKEIRLQLEEVSKLVGEYSNASMSFKADSLKIKRISARLARERNALLKLFTNRIQQRQMELAVLEETITAKQQRLKQYETRIDDLRKVASRIEQVETEIKAMNEAFFSYSQQFEEKRMMQLVDNVRLSNARILSRPFIPAEPAFPQLKIILPIGAMTGFLLALAIGYLREFFDHTFKQPSHVEKYLNIPVFATLDDVSKRKEPSQFEHGVASFIGRMRKKSRSAT